ncbi:PEP-CTERM system TPR-repeat protein PrsT [Thalassotalea euphylliae]|uniref:PEP-CTERM system TPR-repeat protein PrsT n=1 Tax=Thalassotalea euphylliae TaxID=1655234 RepID=A0A3E0TV61_9GAMM|nr:XrtA/PEP-CTERM system TPR-repeat protein PrsT [Thalassotalea euphylliae]REL28566.1 PEP-CTERM system TPR-repeat protein PrsT [Thalassotalea euphylliae]
MNKVSLPVIVWVVIASSGLYGCSDEKSATQHIEEASSLLLANDVDTAIIELKNAIKAEPRNPVARLRLGDAYLKQGNYISAEKELEKSLSLGAGLDVVLPELASVRAKLGDHHGVKQIMEQAVNIEENAYASVLLYAGVSAVATQDIEEAQDLFSQIIGLDQQSLQAQFAKAYLAHTKQDYSKSLLLVDEILIRAPNHRDAMLFKASTLYSQRQYQSANSVLESYLAITPKDHKAAFFNINSLIKAEQYEQADKKLLALLRVFGTSPLGNQYKAEIEYQKGHFEEAKNYAELSEQYGNKSPLVNVLIGLSAYQLGQLEQTYENLIRVENYFEPSHPVFKVLTIVKIKLGYDNETANSLATMDGLTPDDTSLLQLTSFEMANSGNLEAAQKVISKATALSPNNAQVLAQQGVILLSNQDEAGIRSLEKALALDSELAEVELSLAMQYLKSGEIFKTEEIAEKFLSLENTSEYGHLLNGLIQIEKKAYGDAIQNFNKALKVNENSIMALLNLGFLHEQSPDLAFDYYRRVLNLEPGHKVAIQRFTSLSVKLNQASNAIGFLEELRGTSPDNISIILGLAQNYRFNKQVDKAISLLEEFNANESLPPGYWVILGDSYTQQHKFVEANESFAAGLKLYPEHYLLNLRLIGSLELSRDVPKALKAAMAANQVFPNNPRIKMLLAHLELENNNIEAAKKHIEQFRQNNRNNPFIDRLVGKIAMLEGDFATSVEHLTSVYQHNPNSVNAVRLARALKFNGQQAEAEKTLEVYLEGDPNNTRLRLLLAELYTKENKEKIFEQYNWLIAKNPANIAALNNLAWHQHNFQLSEQAIKTIEKAHQQQPKNLMLLETYGVLLVANNNHHQGIVILEQALAAGSKDVDAHISLAQGYIALNKSQEAKAILLALHSANQTRKPEIEDLLSQLN